jgi:hypothetical protein
MVVYLAARQLDFLRDWLGVECERLAAEWANGILNAAERERWYTLEGLWAAFQAAHNLEDH